jgi:hypothetical protein
MPQFQCVAVLELWHGGCPFPGVLRITATTSDKVVLKLEGRLVGPWVDELREAVWRTSGWCRRMEIDVTDLTYVDEDGEKALSWLHRMGARFHGQGPFSQYLFERMKIPLHSRQTAIGKGDKEAQR